MIALVLEYGELKLKHSINKLPYGVIFLYLLCKMISLFDYYDLKIHFRKKDLEPLHVYGSRGDRYSVAKIIFENGLFERIDVSSVPDYEELDEIDTNKMRLLILNHLDEVIKRWIDFYLYKKDVEEEIITQKIEGDNFVN